MSQHRRGGLSASQRRNRMMVLLHVFGPHCFYCGVLTTDDLNGTKLSDAKRTVDHVVPLFYGGKNSARNLVIACHACNSRRGAVDFLIFFAEVNSSLDERHRAIVDCLFEKRIDFVAHYESLTLVELESYLCSIYQNSSRRLELV
jgi:hypothetical protein